MLARRPWTAFAVVPFLLLMGTGGVCASLSCPKTRVASASCCCPGAAGSTPEHQLKPSCGCDGRAVAAPFTEPSRRPDDFDGRQVALPVEAVTLASWMAPAPVQPRLPDLHPRPRPRLTVLHQAFLL